jgi:alkanesulfonate monooxygenase SsuD/methylene tetrahydromethanopterin reductase-like flavin-dependent oxidoreductase (luciferase family)
VRPTEETIDVIRGLWGQSDFSYAGEHFTTTAADLQPKPLRRIPIWLDATYRGLSVVRSAAARAGRDPDELTCGYNIAVMVQEGAAPAKGQVSGGREQVARQSAAFVRGGFSFLNLWPAGDGNRQRERLAHEVIPTLRAMVTAD